MVLVDNSVPGPVSAHLDDSDTVKIIITMSCDPQTAAQLEESVKQSLLENAQVGIILGITSSFSSLGSFKAVRFILCSLPVSQMCSVSVCSSSLLEIYGVYIGPDI